MMPTQNGRRNRKVLVGKSRPTRTIVTAMRTETALLIIVHGLHRDPVDFGL